MAQTGTACHPLTHVAGPAQHPCQPLTLRTSLQEGVFPPVPRARKREPFHSASESPRTPGPSFCAPACPLGVVSPGSRFAQASAALWPPALPSTPWEILSGFSQPQGVRRITRVSGRPSWPCGALPLCLESIAAAPPQVRAGERSLLPCASCGSAWSPPVRMWGVCCCSCGSCASPPAMGREAGVSPGASSPCSFQKGKFPEHSGARFTRKDGSQPTAPLPRGPALRTQPLPSE